MQIDIRTFKKPNLEGGTLIVGVPHVGIGGTILTDYLLDQLEMDQIAGLDSEAFPPFAMVFHGKPRFPVRIHADPKTRIAVLRSELTPLGSWSRPLAKAILEWAHAEKIARIVVPDGIMGPPSRRPKSGRSLPVWFVATDAATRAVALAGGLREFDQGVLGGVVASLLLEARLHKADVVTLLAEFHDPLVDAQTALSLARALLVFVPDLDLDLGELEGALGKIEGVVRALREEAEHVAQQIPPEQRQPMMYG